MILKKNIVLIGFMGCGKTTIGLKLARRLGCEFIDTDRYIENEQKMKISEIFAKHGEDYFRGLEKDLCKRLSSKSGCIIATGGGIIKNADNVKELKKNGFVVYLKASPEHIFRNIGNDDTRPLLQGYKNKLKRISDLMAERIPTYEKHADEIINTAGQTVNRIADKIIERAEKYNMKKLCVIHGPNLNFTGIREKGIYGTRTLDDINEYIVAEGEKLGFEVDTFHSNYEGAIIDKLQKCYFEKYDGIVINPGAFTHYSYALHDAIVSVQIPTVEIHLSNIHKRDEFRHKSVTAPACVGQLCGFGEYGYVMAMMAVKNHIEKNQG